MSVFVAVYKITVILEMVQASATVTIECAFESHVVYCIVSFPMIFSDC